MLLVDELRDDAFGKLFGASRGIIHTPSTSYKDAGPLARLLGLTPEKIAQDPVIVFQVLDRDDYRAAFGLSIALANEMIEGNGMSASWVHPAMNKGQINMTLWRQRGNQGITIPVHVKPKGPQATRDLMLYGASKTDIVGTGMLENCMQEDGDMGELLASLRLSAHDNRTVYIAMAKSKITKPTDNWMQVSLRNPRNVRITKPQGAMFNKVIAELGIDDKSRITF